MACCNKKAKPNNKSCCDRVDIISCCKNKYEPKINGNKIRRKAYKYLKDHNLILPCARQFELPPKISKCKMLAIMKEKLKILSQLDQGFNFTCVARKFGVSACTVKNIWTKQDSIKAEARELGLIKGDDNNDGKLGNLGTTWNPKYTGCQNSATIDVE